MWRILRFLSRFSNLILFLFLQLVALLMVVSLNSSQSRAFGSFSQEISGDLHEISSSISGYFYLKEKNQIIAEQNVLLKKDLVRLKNKLESLRHKIPFSKDFTLLPDSVLSTEGYSFKPCRVINNSTRKNYNRITLDKGSQQGVKQGMGVLSPQGVAGQVVSVSPRFSVALSVINKSFSLSARIKNNRNIGTLSWNGTDPTRASLLYIPQTTNIEKGDTVVTSGFSTIFPRDFMVGVIDDFDTDNHEGFYNISLKLATDFRSLDHVYLVRHEYREELDSLELNTLKQ